MSECAKKPSICFVAQNAYGALAGLDTGHAGGIERQQSMMAKWFAQNGYSVSMITWDEGYADGAEVFGVSLYKMCARNAGLPGMRFLLPRWTSLISALRKANADIYYYNCGDLGLGQIALWSRKRKCKLIFSVSSDISCDPTFPLLKSQRERLLYQYGLRHSDRIIVQTANQKNMLKKGFNCNSEFINMPFEGFSKLTVSQQPSTKKRVLWVGRISQEKRLEWLLEIADKLPDINFDVLGAPNNRSDYSEKLMARMSRTKNVTAHGRVPHQKMFTFYQEADLLCCTSEFEGFPNTFLEAWSAGIPVISTVDPDGIISAQKLGVVETSLHGLLEAVATIMTNHPDRWEMGDRAKRYFHKHYEAESIMPKFEKQFLEVYGGC